MRIGAGYPNDFPQAEDLWLQLSQAEDLRLHMWFFERLILTIKEDGKMEDKKLPVYESPKVVTYTDDEMLEELGPAQTGYVKDCAF